MPLADYWVPVGLTLLFLVIIGLVLGFTLRGSVRGCSQDHLNRCSPDDFSLICGASSGTSAYSACYNECLSLGQAVKSTVHENCLYQDTCLGMVDYDGAWCFW